jgi:hypothetical protein
VQNIFKRCGSFLLLDTVCLSLILLMAFSACTESSKSISSKTTKPSVEKERSEKSPQVSSEKTPAPTVRPTSGPRFTMVRRGQRTVFKLHSATELSSDIDQFGQPTNGPTGGGAGALNPTTVHSQLKAAWTESRIEHDKGGLLVAFQVQSLEMSSLINGQVVEAPAAHLASILKSISVIEIDLATSRIGSLFFDPALSELEQNVIRTIVGGRQFVRSDDQRALKWTVEEDDLNGRSVAEYERVESDESTQEYVKRRLKYLPEPFLWTPRQAPIEKVYKPSGFQRFSVDQSGLVTSIGDERLTLLAAGRSLRTTKTKYSIRRESFTALDELQSKAVLRSIEAAMGSAKKTSLYVQPNRKATPLAQHRQDLEGQTLPQLLDVLGQIERDPDNTRSQQRSVYHHLKAWIALNPTKVQVLMPLFAKTAVDGPVFGILCTTLSTAGSAEAQAVLVKSLKSTLSDVERTTTIIGYLGRVEAPTEATRGAVLKIADTTKNSVVREAASLSVGALALMSRAAEEGSQSELVSWMIRQFKSASEPNQIALMLRVAGNSGADRLLPFVRPHLTSEDTMTRMFAAQALRWFRTDEAEDIHVEILLNDEAEDVRAKVAEAYQFRPIREAKVEQLIKGATTDTSEIVRLTLASNLWRARYRFPSIEKAVRALARTDPDPKVRNDLGELVGQ